MTDHANELRRHAKKLDGVPCIGDARAVMRAAAAHIEDMERRLREAEGHVHARIDEAVEAEREACAKKMDAIAQTCREENSDYAPFEYAAAIIRARGKK